MISVVRRELQKIPPKQSELMVFTAAKRVVRRLLPHPLYRVIRQRRVAREIARYTPRLHSGVYGGHPLTLQFRDPLAESWYRDDWPVLGDVRLLRELGVLSRGAQVFDLGAHQGIVALMLAAETQGGRVVAVEAEPHNARVASENVALNQPANVTVVPAAVTDFDGVVPFAEGLNGEIDETTRHGNVQVEAVTVASLCARYGPPDLVVVDVEGFEGKVLRAAGPAFASAAFSIEVHVEILVDVMDVSPGEILDVFEGWRRWIAMSEHDDYVPFDGEIPDRRFFLLAAR